ncbi:hypothetical protein BLOT_010655, partial [Blomia tropicalis]
WFEPTDPNLAAKFLDIKKPHLESLKFLSPNLFELKRICAKLTGTSAELNDIQHMDRNEIIDSAIYHGKLLMEKIDSIYGVLVTIGQHGIVYISYDSNLDSSIDFGPNSSLFERKSSEIKTVHIDSPKIDNIVNLSGAGDCLVGAIIYGLIQEKTIRQSFEMGLDAARMSIQSIDTVPTNIVQILEQSKLL